MASPWIWILVVVVVLALVYIKAGDILLFPLKSKKANGVIVNWMQRKFKGEILFHPVIEYIDHLGEKIQYRSEDSCKGKPMYPQGTKVTVLYSAKNSQLIKIKYPKG